MPVEPYPAERRVLDHDPVATNAALRVLISPSRDVQVGSLRNGRWVTATASSFEVQGLVRSPSTNPPAVWGAMIGGGLGERTLQVQGPLGEYDVLFPSALGAVADGAEITVFVSDHVRITDSSARRVQALKDPAPDAPVFVSRAALSGGLYPFTPTPDVPISLGLTMRRRGLDTKLVTADGTVIGAGVLDALPERWEAALGITEGRMIVVYGAAIGVRPSAPNAPFPDADTHAELMQAGATGTAAWGLVGWS